MNAGEPTLFATTSSSPSLVNISEMPKSTILLPSTPTNIARKRETHLTVLRSSRKQMLSGLMSRWMQ